MRRNFLQNVLVTFPLIRACRTRSTCAAASRFPSTYLARLGSLGHPRDHHRSHQVDLLVQSGRSADPMDPLYRGNRVVDKGVPKYLLVTIRKKRSDDMLVLICSTVLFGTIVSGASN
jgi:hypothetical protein